MNYKSIHDFIIERAKKRPIEGYVERHHIVPTCLLNKPNNSEENLVYLTAREHFIIHKILTILYPNISALHLAVFAMANGWSSKFNERNYRISSREYMRLKINASISQSKKLKERYEDPIERAKTSDQMKERWKDPNFANKMSDALKQKWADPTYKSKLSKKHKERYEDPIERAKTSESTKKYFDNNPLTKELLSSKMKDRWKCPEYINTMRTNSSGINNGMSKSLKLTLQNGKIYNCDTIVEALGLLGFKSYGPVYAALKNGGTHPKYKWSIEYI
tara:strand:- start:89 stop:916 length:828 start_codon:yes stop_codon:yes gene_type:complete